MNGLGLTAMILLASHCISAATGASTTTTPTTPTFFGWNRFNASTIEWLFACGWQTNPGRFCDAVSTWNVVSEWFKNRFSHAGSPPIRISGAVELIWCDKKKFRTNGLSPGCKLWFLTRFLGKWLSYFTLPFEKVTYPTENSHFSLKNGPFQKDRVCLPSKMLYPLRWHLKRGFLLETIIFFGFM